MNTQLTWKHFLYLQPAILFFAYLTGCFVDATVQVLPYDASEFPINRTVLVLELPMAAAIELVLFSLKRRTLPSGRMLVLLLVLVPFAASVCLQLFKVLVSMVVRIAPAG